MSHRKAPQPHYQDIYNSIVIPSSLPLETSGHDYKKSHADEVVRLMNNGYSFHEAYQRSTGVSAPKNIKKTSKMPLVAGILGLAGVLAAGIVGFSTLGIPVAQSSQVSSQESMADIQAASEDHTILVAGMDTRPEKDQGDGSSQDVPGNRTDALAVVKITPQNESNPISIASIPRDTGVDTSICSDGDGQIVKINSVFDDYGLGCLEEIAEDITGVDIDSAITLNFNAFSTVVDSLGGITITTDSPVIDDTLGEIIPKAGTHHIDGATALDYARARKVEGTSKNDLERVKRQQDVALASIKAVKDASFATQLSTVKDVITKILPDTTIQGIFPADILPLLKLAGSIEPGSITASTIDIIGEDELGNLIYDRQTSRHIFNEVTTHPEYQLDHQVEGEH